MAMPPNPSPTPNAAPRHGVGVEGFLPFAQGAGGRMVHVSEVSKGLACGCVCPACGGALVAKKGEVLAAHFAHQADSNCSSGNAYETTLHRLGKQIISERLLVSLPPVVAQGLGKQEPLSRGGVCRFERVDEEVTMPGMRPDIVAYRGGQPLLIEIHVSHPCSPEKRALIRKLRLPTIEIHLSPDLGFADLHAIEQAVLYDSPREWLFNAAAAEWQDKFWEKHERNRKALQESAKRLAETYRTAIRSSWAKAKIDDAELIRGAIRRLSMVSDSELERHTGVSIPKEECFRVTSRIWQGVLLGNMLIAPHVPVRPHHVSSYRNGENGMADIVHDAYLPAMVGSSELYHAVFGPETHPGRVMEAYLWTLSQKGIVQSTDGDYWVLTPSALSAAKEALERTAFSRKRVADLRDAYDETAVLVGTSPGPFDAWADTLLPDMLLTPRACAQAGSEDLGRLLRTLRRIGALKGYRPEPVGEPLLGFPVDALEVQARAEKQRRADEEQARHEAHQKKLADEAQARREKLAEDKRQQAAERHQRMTDNIHRLLCEEADDFMTQGRGCLGGRPFAEMGGLLTSDEYYAIGDDVDERSKVRRRDLAVKTEIQKWKMKLENEAIRLVGDRSGPYLNSPYPELGKAKPKDFCVDSATYDKCVALLTKRKSR